MGGPVSFGVETAIAFHLAIFTAPSDPNLDFLIGLWMSASLSSLSIFEIISNFDVDVAFASFFSMVAVRQKILVSLKRTE